MLNLFGKNVFARKRKAKVMPIDTMSRIETLEDRLVLAGQVTSLYSNGALTITGSGAVDNLVLTFTATNTVTISGLTTISGAGAGPFVVTGDLSVSMGNGNDTVSIVGGGFSLDSGNVAIDLGSADDTLTTSGNFSFTGNVSITGGTGVDSITVGAAASAISIFDLNIDAGTDLTATNQAKTIVLNSVTAHNVTLATGGTGVQAVTLGSTTANSFTGNVKISQNGIGATSHTTAITNSPITVGGNLSITNANAATNVVSLTTTNVAGTTSIVNGNATTTLNSVTFTGAQTLGGSVTVKNGSANTTNTITATGTTFNGRNSSFTNGSAVTSNTINLGLTTASTFAGFVAAANGASTGLNLIEVQQGTFSIGGTLVNGTAGTTNTITVGSAGAVGVTAGNLVITNGVATTSNNVNINQLTTAGAKLGDVTINNAGTAATNVLLGATTANTFAGNLTVRNQATTGTRTTSINRTTVNGGVGAYIYNVGAGVAAYNVGTAATSTVLNTLKIEDGSGSATLTLQAATLGALNYADIGGGVDTLAIAATAANTVTVNGVTKLNTGLGSDVVGIAAAGTAVFNDSVFITLGSGNDGLTIGATAASPAFSTADKFQFDGGAGVDTVTVNPLSIADYEMTTPPSNTFPGKKLRFKITNFETYA